MPSLVRAVRLSAAIAVSVVALAPDSSAFCRVTTCDPTETSCDRDVDGCLVGGASLQADEFGGICRFYDMPVI